MTRTATLRRLFGTALLLATVMATLRPLATHAAAPPHRADANLGVVIAHPRIVNLLWDDNWNAHHPTMTEHTIDLFTLALASNGYLTRAAQYGVGSASFGGAYLASAFCGARRPNTTVHFVDIQAWVTCEASNPLAGTPAPSVGLPISTILYVVYLPAGVTINDSVTFPAINVLGHTFGPYPFSSVSCSDYGAYHFSSTSPLGPFAYAVVPAQCAHGALSSLTYAASHEIVEAATDPLILAGWTDDSKSLIGRLRGGEVADICSSGGDVPSPAVSLSGFIFAPYWSNQAAACVA
ncbi:MAG TPA: hypothetical protein VHB98_01860 [Chloroflexota bacterium]|nr:hypothetical protein [Chloroflexota bacterium]